MIKAESPADNSRRRDIPTTQVMIAVLAHSLNMVKKSDGVRPKQMGS